jgi:hypothetical protein
VQLLVESRRNELRVLKYEPGDKLSLTSDGFARRAARSLPGSNANTSQHSGKCRQFRPFGAANSTM